MVTISSEQSVTNEADSMPIETSQQFLISHKFITHNPKSGLNQLIDAAGYLFSLIGKIKQIKSYRHLNQLQSELIEEINTFQEAAKASGYSSEYVVVSRYALCSTLDDLISNTLWGAQGQWESYRLLASFNQEAAHQDRFFIILERIVKDPALYIDVMEFMYVCLSLGYKGQYRATEFSNNQLEQIINSLYKRIRAYRGDFSKILSPFPIKPSKQEPKSTLSSALHPWLVLFLASSIIAAIFLGMGLVLDRVANQAYQDLMQIGHISSYETADKE